MKNPFHWPILVGVAVVPLVLGAVVASAGEPATTAAATPSAPVVTTPMTQEQLLAHLEQHADHVFVLDVRSPQEFAEGHVPGALNVPYDQVAGRLGEIPRDKDVVLYCRSGRRAGLAADVLAAHGYRRLSHLEGDMPEWIARGRPVEK
jgi:phage shock protein E